MKKKILLLTLSATMLIGLIGCGNSKRPDLTAIYDEYCSSIWASVGSDGSYLTIDTNPDNEEDAGVAYYTAVYAILNVNDALGLPESLYNDMAGTTALMGKQSETFSDAGVTASWSCHPDNGLEVTYKLINE